MDPILQVSLDFIDLPRAIKVAKEAVAGGADWIEAGTPLIKSCGLEAVRTLKKEFPGIPIVADMKIMDTGRLEVEIAAKSGADVVVVMGNASDQTIAEAIEAGKAYGVKVVVDLMELALTPKRAKEVARLSPDYIGIHIPIDQQMSGTASYKIVEEIGAEVDIPLAVAGGINSENIVDVIHAGASLLIVGGAITKSENATNATIQIKEAVRSKEKISTTLFRRATSETIGEILSKVSTANISDAMHRHGWIPGIKPIGIVKRFFGPAITVRTLPGDWAKPVEAIDLAKPGDVIIIDVGGLPPAVWGELATYSAVEKKIAAVVIHGAIRDLEEIKETGFPAYAKEFCPQAGEPKGYGEINVAIEIEGVTVEPGDWIVGDRDGVVCIPNAKAVEMTNRAMDVLERENRLRKEIQQGSTLSEITELLKWEKQ
ncbi:MAG: orotidine 5'-phosphate decarboxylase / HUMPS family protein [Candidatus Ratteibacteria bacterium]|jgi:3-hexulose-6-phosphate synthase/6-phospho-3-hexuloisomerase